MDEKLLQETIEFVEWVKQWYYSTPAELEKINMMLSRLVAEQTAERRKFARGAEVVNRAKG